MIAGQPDIPAAARRIHALAPLSPDEMQLLREVAARSRTLRARSEIWREGQAILGPLLMVDGWAARVRILDDGRRQFISFLLPGDIIGMCRQLQPLAVSTIVTLTPAEICPLPMASGTPALDHAYGVSQALDEAYLLAQITRIGRLSAAERIADLLLEFLERLSLAGLARDNGFDLPLTQEMLADALGLTSVHVNRMLQQERRDDDIYWERGRVVIVDPPTLAAKIGRVSPRVSAISPGPMS